MFGLYNYNRITGTHDLRVVHGTAGRLGPEARVAVTRNSLVRNSLGHEGSRKHLNATLQNRLNILVEALLYPYMQTLSRVPKVMRAQHLPQKHGVSKPGQLRKKLQPETSRSGFRLRATSQIPIRVVFIPIILGLTAVIVGTWEV